MLGFCKSGHIYGRRFQLVTDHKPLTTILRTGLPTLAAAWLQRWAIMLSAYQYDIEFQPTHKHGNADCLSLPLNTPATAGQADAASLFNIHQIGTFPVNAGQLKQQRGQDPILAKVMDFTLTGWSSTAPPELKPFFN